jgi:hypothetical protein
LGRNFNYLKNIFFISQLINRIKLLCAFSFPTGKPSWERKTAVLRNFESYKNSKVMKKAILMAEMNPEDLQAMMEEAIRKILFEQGISSELRKDTGLLDDNGILEILGVSKATLYLWRRDRKIPFQRIGKKIFYNLQEVQKAMGKLTDKESVRHRRASRRKEDNQQ